MTNIRAIINSLALLGLSMMASTAIAASLNKCVDAYGKVTYSNMTCKGANEIRKIEIDPAPPVPPPAPLHSTSKVDVHSTSKVDVPVYVMPETSPVPLIHATPLEKKPVIKLETFGATPKKQSQNTCDKFTDKLGLVLDKMDAARRKGYTQKQMDEWNLEIKSLERKKQQAGCF